MGNRSTRSQWAINLERLSLAVERPVNRLIGNYQINPFYHTGTIAVFLLAVVAVTGFFLFLFFQYGFDASYNAVLTRIETPLIARTLRAVHRYASGALVVTVFLHAWRMLFMERFRGPRVLAWLTGIVMTFILWLDGISGYWLVWDTRAQLINERFIRFLAQRTPYAPDYLFWLVRAELSDKSWPIFMWGLGIHILLFLIVAGFYGLHIRHLKRARWLPPTEWMVGASTVLLLTALFVPSGMLPQADLTRLPGMLRLDPIFLYYLPVDAQAWSNLLWGGMWLATGVAVVLPFWRRQQTTDAPKIAQVIADNCVGCAKCAADCPYGAIEMIDLPNGSQHPKLAQIDASNCVGCGICVGSCDSFLAIQLGDDPPDAVWQKVEAVMCVDEVVRPKKIIFTCNRHAAFLEEDAAIIPLTCTGAIQPHILPRVLAAGAEEVTIVGCPPYDCINREGNLWEEQRITNERVPRLRKRHDHDPITAAWLPPDEFQSVVPLASIPVNDDETTQPDYLSTRALFDWLTWRNIGAGSFLLTVVLFIQIALTGLSFTPYPNPPARLRLLFVEMTENITMLGAAGEPLQLQVEIDSVLVDEIDWNSATSQPDPRYFNQFDLTPGSHSVHVYWQNADQTLHDDLYVGRIEIDAGEQITLHDLNKRHLDRCPLLRCDEP